MSVHRKRYSADEKARVAIEAIKGQKTRERAGGRIWRASQSDYAMEKAGCRRDEPGLRGRTGATRAQQ